MTRLMRCLRETRTGHNQQTGFSLVEVLVSVLITSIAVVGLIGMQGIAARNMQTARTRSIVAMQAESLATAMHGNRRFWSFGNAPANFRVAGTTIPDPSGLLKTQSVRCTSETPAPTGECTPDNLASFDVQTWASSMAQLVPTYQAASECGTDETRSFTCALTITWVERYVRNAQTVANDSLATSGMQSFTLYIQP